MHRPLRGIKVLMHLCDVLHGAGVHSAGTHASTLGQPGCVVVRAVVGAQVAIDPAHLHSPTPLHFLFWQQPGQPSQPLLW